MPENTNIKQRKSKKYIPEEIKSDENKLHKHKLSVYTYIYILTSLYNYI